MPPRLSTVGLALLLVLSGCSGLVPDEGTPEPTLTPAPVPGDTPEPTPTPERLAPGLTTAGVDNATALAAAHAARVNGTYVLRRNVTVRNRNINVVTRSHTLLRDNGSRERYRDTSLFDGPAVEYYHANGTAWRRTVENGTVTYDRTVVDPQFDGSAISIATLLEQTDARVVSRTRSNMTVRYELVARDVSSGAVFTPGELWNVSDVTVGAVVVSDDRGTYVRRFAVWYGAEHEGQRVSVELRMAFSPYDRVTVPEPDWLPEARNRTGTTA